MSGGGTDVSAGHVDMIVLAGGRSRRMRGPDKLAALVGGVPILARVVSACASATAKGNVIVAAGQGPASIAQRSDTLHALPAAMRARVRLVSDDPALDGPVAGLTAALGEATASIVVVVAADMPFVTSTALERLETALSETAPDEAWLAVAVDAEGRRQFACCAWRRDRLIEMLAAERPSARPGRGIALKALILPVEARGLARLVPLSDTDALLDVDDPEDLERARTLESNKTT